MAGALGSDGQTSCCRSRRQEEQMPSGRRWRRLRCCCPWTQLVGRPQRARECLRQPQGWASGRLLPLAGSPIWQRCWVP